MFQVQNELPASLVPCRPLALVPYFHIGWPHLCFQAAFTGAEYQFVRTFTQLLVSAIGKLVSTNSKPSSGSGNRWSLWIASAAPTHNSE